MFELGGKRHSGLGIASFVTTVVAVVILIIALIISIMLVIKGVTPGSLYFALAGMGLILSFVLNLVAAGLSIFSLFLKGYKRIFPILGCVISIAVLIGTIIIIILGAFAQVQGM
jgi:hypothetical protein